MTFFVQYDEAGNINATVESILAPDFSRQLAFSEWPDISGKIVDLSSLELIDALVAEGEE